MNNASTESKYKNRLNEAEVFAGLARQSATAETSGLRYHKYLGVVAANLKSSWLSGY